MNPSSAETRRLVSRAIDGDRSAIDELLACYRPQLRRMVAVRMDSRLKARFDPSDVVQTVLAEAAQKMVSFQRPPERVLPLAPPTRLGRARPAAPRPHPHQETQRHAAKRTIGRPRRRRIDRRNWSITSPREQLGPGSRLVHEELRARVRAAIEELAPQDREVLVLRFLEQLNIAETAAALGLTESAVKSRQFRAIERLGKLLS